MKVRKKGIATQIMTIMAILIVCMNLLEGFIIVVKSKTTFTDLVRNKAENIASCAAGQIDGATFDTITVQTGQNEAFDQVNAILTSFLENSDVEYIYTLRKNEIGDVVFVVDADPEEPAEIEEYYGLDEGMKGAFLGITSSDAKVTEDEWGTHLSAYSPIMNGSKVVGLVGVDISYDWVEGQILQMQQMIIVLFAVSFLLLFVAISLLGRSMRAKFSLLNEKVVELADGSGDLERKIELRSGDEFEVVADSINRFIEQIRHLVSTVGQLSARNAQTIAEMNQGIMDLSANMEECSATGETISVQLTDTAGQVETLAEQIGQVEQKTKQSSETANHSSKIAIEHKLQADEQIAELREELERTTREAESIKKVQSIVAKIGDIAMQTKILSLNAQLEAARAGDQGLGFEVVATQVEKLSEQIESSVMEIGDISGQVLQAMNNLLESVTSLENFVLQNVMEDYKAFAELGEEYGTVTRDIREDMSILKSRSAEIAQKVGTADRSIQDISKAVSDSAGKIERLSGSSNQISEDMVKLLENDILRQR